MEEGGQIAGFWGRLVQDLLNSDASRGGMGKTRGVEEDWENGKEE